MIDLAKYIETTFAKIDESGDGLISALEFTETVLKEPVILEGMIRCVPATLSMDFEARVSLRELVERSGLDFMKLGQLWKGMRVFINKDPPKATQMPNPELSPRTPRTPGLMPAQQRPAGTTRDLRAAHQHDYQYHHTQAVRKSSLSARPPAPSTANKRPSFSVSSRGRSVSVSSHQLLDETQRRKHQQQTRIDKMRVKLRFADFNYVMYQMLDPPQLEDGRLVRRLFGHHSICPFKEEDDGPPVETLEFDESYVLDGHAFVSALASTLGHGSSTNVADIEARSRFFFALYDVDNDGTLTRAEVYQAMCDRHGELGDQIEYVLNLLLEADHDHDGVLTKEEFFELARSHPTLIECLHGSL